MNVTVNIPTEISVDGREIDKPFWVVYRRDATVYRGFGYKTRRGADAAAERMNQHGFRLDPHWVVVENPRV